MSLDKLLSVIRKAKHDFCIEGITLSGGEPTLQKALPLLLQHVHEMGLGIILFSGRTFDNIDVSIINNVDLLIDGPFIEEQIDQERVLLGSKNKRLLFVTKRYLSQEQYFNNPVASEEIALGTDYIFINGD